MGFQTSRKIKINFCAFIKTKRTADFMIVVSVIHRYYSFTSQI